MSWDVYLLGAEVGHHEHTGGTFQVGGTDQAWLNVTYNYGQVYRLAAARACLDGELSLKHELVFRDLDGRVPSIIEWLQGQRARNTRSEMIAVRSALWPSDRDLPPPYPDEDYWAPTPVNAARALDVLIEWGGMLPNFDCKWEVH